MKHTFTDEQIIDAFEDAELAGDWKAFRTFLDHPPEPRDDWQECRRMEYKPGDRMMRESNRIILVYKSPIRAVHDHYVELEDKNVHHFRTDMIYYRIPKPVTPPDPAQHPVIMVHLHNGVKETKRAFVWNGESYGCLDGPHSFLAPYQITKWSPAKVVEDDR